MHPHYKDQSANAITERIAVQCEKGTESINIFSLGGEGGAVGNNDC